MALESVTYITDLVATNPTSTDLRSQGDDHIRNIKTAVKTLSTSSGASYVGYLPSGSGASATDIQTQLRRDIWLNNYATADNATDAAAGFANAMAALPTEGGTLYYSGIFYFASIITITKRIKIVAVGGDGDGTLSNLPSSYFRFSSAIVAGPLIQITNHGSQFDGLHVEGGGKGTNTAVDNIQFLGSSHNLIRVKSWKAGRDGVKIGAGTSSATICNAGYTSDVICFENGGVGFKMDNNTTSPAGNNANAWDLGGVRAYNNTGDGIVLDHADLNTLTGSLSENNTGWGLSLLNANYNVISGGDREANTAGQIRILGSRAGGNGTNTSNYNVVLIGNPTELTDADSTLPTGTTKNLSQSYLLQGTFTPTFTGSTSGSHASYTTQQGHWHRQGDMVWGSIALQANGALSGPVGNLEISGLDYTLPSGFTNGFFGVSISQYNGMTFSAGLTQMMGRIDPNTAKIKLTLAGSATAVAFLPVSGVGSNAQVYLSFFYPVVDI